MSGLIDLAPLTEEVVLGPGPKQRLTVSGLTVDDIFFLVRAFPEVKALLERRLKDITPERMMEAAPKTLATIVACATGERDNDKAVNAAQRLNADATLKILGVIFKLTFPEGVGPFVRSLQGLQASFGASTSPPQAASNTTSSGDATEANGRSASNSLPPMSAALDMDEASRKHYAPHRAH